MDCCLVCIKHLSGHSKMCSLLTVETLSPEFQSLVRLYCPPSNLSPHHHDWDPTMNQDHPLLVLGAAIGQWTRVSGSGGTNWLVPGLHPPMYLGNTRSS